MSSILDFINKIISGTSISRKNRPSPLFGNETPLFKEV